MSLLDDLIFGFSGQPTEEGSEPILGILGFVLWIVIIIG